MLISTSGLNSRVQTAKECSGSHVCLTRSVTGPASWDTMQAPQIWRTLEHKTTPIEHALPNEHVACHSWWKPLLDMLAMYLATLTALTQVLIEMQNHSHRAKSSLASLQSGSLMSIMSSQ